MSIKECSFQEAVQSGLTVFNPKIRRRLAIEFQDLSDTETICYIMCHCLGWSSRRLAKLLNASKTSVNKTIKSALDKR